MNIFKKVLIFMLLIFITTFAYGDTVNESETKNSSQDISVLFPDTEKYSKEIARKIAKKEPIGKIVELWEESIIKESQFLIDAGIDLKPHLKKLFEKLKKDKLTILPDFFIQRDPFKSGYYIFKVDNSGLDIGFFDEETNSKCNEKYNCDCYNVLLNLHKAIKRYKEKVIIDMTEEALDNFKTFEWEDYFTNARSQLPWELALNSFLYKSFKEKYLIGPPKYQMILLHPEILFEYVDKADDGSKFKEAFAIEIVGVNFWNTSLPFGMSIMGAYSDRSGTGDLGLGLLFHINNNLSFGITKNEDDDIGGSVSIDLLKYYETKKSQLKKYGSFIKK